MTTATTATTISPYKLLPHPFNAQIYGIEQRDPDLEKSIGQNGILTPVDVVFTTINFVEGYYILSGHRRVEVAKTLKLPVPVVIQKDQGELWQRNFLLESNIQRIKTLEQRTREYQERLAIEKTLAESRRAAGIYLPGTASERASAAVGLDDRLARRMNVIISEADKGNTAAAAGLEEIRKGTRTPQVVYNLVSPREADEASANYDEIARQLQTKSEFFAVEYSPRNREPRHGFVFKRRFACVEEAEAFLDMLAQIPEEKRAEFNRISASWQK